MVQKEVSSVPVWLGQQAQFKARVVIAGNHAKRIEQLGNEKERLNFERAFALFEAARAASPAFVSSRRRCFAFSRTRRNSLHEGPHQPIVLTSSRGV